MPCSRRILSSARKVLLLLTAWPASLLTVFGQVQHGTFDGISAGDLFGESFNVSADGSRLVIGAPLNDAGGINAGQVRTFDWNGTVWTEVGTPLNGVAAGDNRGGAIWLSADGYVLAVGAHANDGTATNAGHVQVFSWNGSDWTPMGPAVGGESSGDNAGWTAVLSESGTRLAVGSPNNSNGGQVEVYDWNGSTWVQLGSDINGPSPAFLAGWTLSLTADGNRLAVGIPRDPSNTGRVIVYDWNGSAWVQAGSTLFGNASNDWAGECVAISADGNRLAFGARYSSTYGFEAGYVKVFGWNSSNWTQMGSTIAGEAVGDWTGESIFLSEDGNRLVVGAPRHDANGTNAGRARLFDWDGTQWTQIGVNLAGEAVDDQFGHEVVLSRDGHRLFVGAEYSDVRGTNAGRVYAFTLSEFLPCTVDLGADTIIAASETLTLTAPPGYDGYLWSTGETTPSIIISEPGTYTITVSTLSGCNATDAITLTAPNIGCIWDVYPAVLDNGLIAWYPFDNGAALDASTNENHGTLFGAVAVPDQTEASNSALDFDGFNDYAAITASSNFQHIYSGTTYACWVKVSSNASGNIF